MTFHYRPSSLRIPLKNSRNPADQLCRMNFLRRVPDLALGLILSLCLPCVVLCAPADIPPAAHAECGLRAPGGRWSGAAQWIAGSSDDAFSAGLTSEQHAAWNEFSKLSNSDWTKLRKQYLDRIEVWRNLNLGEAPARDIAFYPFGGPDAANLLTFFPDARDYILMGLEPVGCVPSAITDYTPEYFAALRHSLSSVVTIGFFITADMRRDVTQTDLNGVLPLLLFLVSRSGYTVTNVASIGISPSGDVAPSASLPQVEARGVAIQFSDSRHGVRTLRYFSVNLDDTLKTRPGTSTYLKSLPGTVTLLKAASYLMHHPNFSTIRNTVLAKSRLVVEEDSGVPYRYFDQAGWDVRLFGTYSEPIQLFKQWSQNDLKIAYSAGAGVQPLDFGVGYQQRGKSNLLVAQRKTNGSQAR
jgi:hypothetical protein